jgi:hypothetical protein
MFHTKIVQKIKTHIFFCDHQVFFSSKTMLLSDTGKWFTAWQATHESMAHVHGMLHN